jgi:SAM-dependent methyltransferase
MSKTACIVPWSSLVLGPDGRATFCCDVPQPLTVEGRQGSIYQDTLDDLWNAPTLVEVRAAMAAGEKPATCRVCWDREAAGGISRRLLTNAVYRQLGGRLPVEAVTRDGAASGFRLERRPDWFILQLGNVCGLKCRSCSPLYSARIAADPVHAAWAAHEPAPALAVEPAAGASAEAGPRRRPRLAPQGTAAWFDDVDSVADMIASGAGGNAMLSLMGGEPFLIDSVWQLLHALVARGVAANILVALATNGQHRRAELAGLAPRFRGFNLSLSIDARGKLYEYLRHGASWRTLRDNLEWFRQVPSLDLAAVPTLQNGNALDMVPLLRFLDEQGLRLAFNVLTSPARLRPTTLPPSVRCIAARRLHGYLIAECRPHNAPVVRGYCEALEEAGDEFDSGLFGEYMAFTNDLDASRGESLREAAPELTALVKAAGVAWSDARRHGVAGAGAARPPFPPTSALDRINRTVAARDSLFAGFESAGPGAYFSSAVAQLAELDALLRRHGHAGLADSRAIADFACHYGRLTRALRATLPHAAVYACDIDGGALRFCAGELGALPVMTSWRPDEDSLPAGLDAVLCVSLLTHTPIAHWRSALRAWLRMLRPGGVAVFTYLAPHHLDAWLAGTMEHYGTYDREARAAAAAALREDGFGYAALTSGYGGEPLYGIAFATPQVVRQEVAAAGFQLLALPDETSPTFAQQLALARRPEERSTARAPGATPPAGDTVAAGAVREASDAAATGTALAAGAAHGGAATPGGPAPGAAGAEGAAEGIAVAGAAAGDDAAVRRDVSLVALYDPRCYAPAADGEGEPAASSWARLAAAQPPRPLPTELGFGDPRVPEVREAQAALAREHGVDAFCYLYPWQGGGPRWDAPWRDLLLGGRPDFPFCLLLDVEDAEPLSTVDAARLFDSLAAGLADRRYLRIAGRCLLIVRDAGRLAEPRAAAHAWRAAAAAAGAGELHLCAAEPVPADRPEDLGFDSFLETPAPANDLTTAVAAARARPRPSYRINRRVECRRDAADPETAELYEHWLRSAIDATRQRGESLVVLDSWNDWPRGRYLEPDDRAGRAALLATRRSARGPASGLVLLRQLRDALGAVAGRPAAVIAELEQVLALHEHTRDRLLATVEAALGRNPSSLPETQRWVPVASRQLPPSGGGLCLDRVGSVGGPELYGAREPIPLRGTEVSLAGWAHAGGEPSEVDLFLALEAANGTDDRIFRVAERRERPDVAAALPGHPGNCGFDTIVELFGMAPGTYRVAIVQRTPRAAYRDVTAVSVRIEGAGCSKT